MRCFVTSAYRDMLVCLLALLCLVPMSLSAPLTCKDLVRPLDQLNPRDLEGRWASVADSFKVLKTDEPIELSDSVGIVFYNSTFTKTNRHGQKCYYFSHNISIEGAHYKFSVGPLSHFSGTFFHTSCADCVLLSFNQDSPHQKTEELVLFSKSRQVDQKDLAEFMSLAKCLNMPRPSVMDPTEPLCPMGCNNLVRPLDQLNHRDLEGRWASVAGSFKVVETDKPIELSDSVGIVFYNSTFIKTNRHGEKCYNFSHSVSIEGGHYKFSVGPLFHFSGTFFHTSCADCVLLSFNTYSPHYKTEELVLFSKSRQVDQNYLDEFMSVANCLNMPRPSVMDPTVALCPVADF